MCGICVIFQTDDLESVEPIETLIGGTRLHNRGPDICHSQKCKIVHPGFSCFFHGCSLCFQGQPTSQPLQDEAGNLLLWNGEIFGGIEIHSPGENDGRVLLSLLNGCQSDEQILQTLGKVQGPWAFVYWQVKAKTLWFGRDIFGRRSLLYHLSENKQRFVLASVNIPAFNPMREVPANGIYRLPFDTEVIDHLILHPWLETATSSGQDETQPGACVQLYNTTLADDLTLWSDIDIRRSDLGITCYLQPFNSELPLDEDQLASREVIGDVDLIGSAFDGEEELAEQLINVLSESVRLRIHRQANLCDNCLKKHHAAIWSQDQREGSRCQQLNPYRNNIQDRDSTVTSSDQYDMGAAGCLHSNHAKNDTSVSETAKMQDLSLTTHISTHESHCTSISRSDPMQKLHDESNCKCADSTAKCSAVTDLYVGKPSENIELPSMKSTSTGVGDDLRSRRQVCCGHAKVAVLFSGGIDSLIIAALADRYVNLEDPIDLINVAFEQKTNENPQPRNRKKTPVLNDGGRKGQPFDVPDRLTGKLGLEQLNPRRTWNFIEVNVTAQELQEARTAHVRELVYPQNTVLDDSIGCAIWFAARGAGLITDADGQTRTYTTTARVLLLGMGADEQLAGYSRHRGKFKADGWKGLVDEIRMEIERISSRNLGRDDRVISDHGREARFPFLDENVVSFLNSLPIWQKADLNLPRGVGEKKLLRVCAAKLGLRRSAMLPKRAIQFGSRIAKLENKKEKASDVCERLQD